MTQAMHPLPAPWGFREFSLKRSLLRWATPRKRQHQCHHQLHHQCHPLSGSLWVSVGWCSALLRCWDRCSSLCSSLQHQVQGGAFWVWEGQRSVGALNHKVKERREEGGKILGLLLCHSDYPQRRRHQRKSRTLILTESGVNPISIEPNTPDSGAVRVNLTSS